MRAIRFFVLAVSLVALSGTASLAEKAGDPGTNVEMPFLIAPMIKDGKLLGYTYISSKLVASSSSAALEIREKVAFIQDAFVRDVNGASVALASDPTKVDVNLLTARLVGDAKKVIGSTKVVSIIFGDGKTDTGMQFSPLHPSQTPSRAEQDQIAAMAVEPTEKKKPEPKPAE
jgi:hypothetical protein